MIVFISLSREPIKIVIKLFSLKKLIVTQYSSYNFYQENTEHFLAKIMPAMQVTKHRDYNIYQKIGRSWQRC